MLFTVGAEGVFLALAAVYAATAWLAVSIRTPFQPPSRRHAEARSFWRDSIGGVTLFFGRGGRAHFALYLTQRLMGGLVTAFVILYAHDVAGAKGDAASGTLLAALGVGAFVGSAAALVTSGHNRLWLVIGAVLISLPVAAVGLTRQLPVAVALLAVSGAGAALAGSHGAALLSRWLPDHVAGRAWGALFGVGAAAAAVGSLAAPALAHLLGLAEAMVPVGLLAALVPLLCIPGLRFLETRATPAPEALAVISRTEVLGPLPDLCLARLAAAARTRQVAPGDVVVREGDIGDDFFMVDSGELVVTQQGPRGTTPRPRRLLRRGRAAPLHPPHGHGRRGHRRLAVLLGPRALRGHRHRSRRDRGLGRRRRRGPAGRGRAAYQDLTPLVVGFLHMSCAP